MKLFRIIFLSFCIVIGTSVLMPSKLDAQCAMCSLNAENSTQNGNSQGKGLNNGILFLLAFPFLLGGGIAILWYTKFRHKETKSPIL
ncbi:hypothetical protein [Sphingobacterium bovistauri]|nr:hypothetical protein [Sphingobacterium bovistauri]